MPLVLLSFSFSVSADDDQLDYLFPSKRVYLGVNLGGGWTEWKYLVDTTDPEDNNTDLATPSNVKEGGPSWGAVFGFTVSKNFAMELQYMQFANATIYFGPDNYYYVANGVSSMVSKTRAYSLSGKFLVPVGIKTHLRAFAAVGAGLVDRDDIINKLSCISPYLSAGLNYAFTQHWNLESGFQYYTGFGASELLPVNDFIPFAWDAYARLAYQF